MQTLLLDAPSLMQVVRGVGLNVLMNELISRLQTVLCKLDGTAYEMPTRAGFDYEEPHTGLIEWMPLHQRGESVTIKTVGYHPANPKTHGLPTILSNVGCYDVDSGHLAALMDGTFLTALRTGAASGVASRVLARPESRTLGIIGCGAQAVSQLHALSLLFPIDSVLVSDTEWSAIQTLGERCAGFLRETNIKLEPTDSSAIVARADILCTCTSVKAGCGPVFSADASLPELLHVNAVGSDFPGKTEIPQSILSKAMVCPDFYEQAVREGECQQLEPAQIGPNLAQIVSNSAEYRCHQDRLTVFDSTGWALEDHIAAQMLIDFAREMNVGRMVQIESASSDPRDPYAFAASLDVSQRQ